MSDGGLPKPLAEMSDRELEEELQRRRRMRAAKKASPITEQDRRALAVFERSELGGAGPRASTSDMAAAVERADLARHYAALELRPGATPAEVERSYRQLLAKYDPAKHAGNPEKHRAATQLVDELTRAYQALSAARA
jgi:DnaJ-class molecular chaperone